ncbi:MAG: T9SS type A sorting domain-containing protein [Flavipsychrobacter sp.]
MKKVTSYIVVLLLLSAAVTTAQPVRPLYQVHYDKSTQPSGTKLYINDSTVYVYVPGSMRGSTPMCDTVHYDSLKRYAVDPSTLKATLTSVYVRLYNSNNQLLKYTITGKDVGGWKEMMRFEWSYSNGMVSNYKEYYDLYDNNSGNFYYGLAAERRYSYNTNGTVSLMDLFADQGYIGLPLMHTSKTYYKYNSKSIKIADSLLNNIGGTWKHAKFTEYLYNSNDSLIQVDEYGISGGTTKSLSATTYYFYNAKGELMGDSVRTDIPNRPINPRMHFYSRDTSGKIVNESLIMPKSSGNQFIYTEYKYHNNGHVNMVRWGASKTLTQVTFADSTLYYYSWTPTAVPQASSISQELILYPNPATDVLHIDSKVLFDKGYIYNNMGQLVKEINANTTQVDVSMLPAGNYVLQLINSNSQVQRNFVVVK